MDRESNAAVHPPRHALVAGGGSGGHVYPGLAVAEVLAARGWIVTWVGRPDGMERTLVEGAGLPFVELPAAPLVGKGVVQKVKALFTLLASALRGRRLVRRLEAGVVVGTGGYVCAPGVLGARLAGVPSLLVEPNAAAGAATRFLSRWASGAALAYESAGADLACAGEVTGVPVRAEFFQLKPVGREGRPTLMVVGGSQGALQVNELLPAAVESLVGDGVELRVVHQAGTAHEERVRADYAARSLAGIEVEVRGFFDDMPAAIGQADLVISRAGAITLAELCAAGRPSLLVPLQWAGGHQIDNARRLEEAGAAVVAPNDVDSGRMAELLAELLSDRQRLTTMAAAARGLAHEGAATRIAEMVERLEEAA